MTRLRQSDTTFHQLHKVNKVDSHYWRHIVCFFSSSQDWNPDHTSARADIMVDSGWEEIVASRPCSTASRPAMCTSETLHVYYKLYITSIWCSQRRHIVSFSCPCMPSDNVETRPYRMYFFAAMLESTLHLQCSFLLLGAHIIQAVQHCNWFCSTKFTSFRPFSTEKVLHLAAACLSSH